MILRTGCILSFSILTGCATYSTGRSIPAPVESRDTTSIVDPRQTDTSTVESIQSSPIQRREIPQTQLPPASNSVIVTPAPSEPASASSILLAGVDAAIADGDLERAAALCERALRISPRDALFWYRLAAVRVQQGKSSEAEGIARRALSYSGDDAELTDQINTLLRNL